MVSLADAIRLPRDVRLNAGALEDGVRGERYAINETGALVLELAGEPLTVAADTVAHRWDLPLERARADVLGFAWVLNRALLANIECGSGRFAALRLRLLLTLRLLPAGVVPPPRVTRYPLDTTTAFRAAVSTLRATSRRGFALGVVAALAAMHLGAVAGASHAIVEPSLALGVSVGLGLMVHEAVHAALLRGVPAALITRGLRTYVLHPSVEPRRAALVGLVGPAVPALAGVVCAVVSTIAASPSLAVLACPLGAHALSLTVAGRDGRAACGL